MYIQGNRYLSDFEAKKAMIEIGKDLSSRDYCIPGDGSISVRIGPNAVWISVAGADFGDLTQDSFLRVDLNGRQMLGNRQKQLPEDTGAHLAVYRQNPQIQCVLHSYPPLLVALGLKGGSIREADFTPALKQLGAIPLVRAETAEELQQQTASAAVSVNGLLVAGNGCITWADSPKKAYQMTKAADYYEKIRKAGGGCENGSCDTCAFRGASVAPAYCSKAENSRSAGSVNHGAAGTGEPVQDGITPIIRPGDANAFHLPDGSKPADSQSAGQKTGSSVSVNAYERPKESTGFKAHPVTISSPSNAGFMKNSFTPTHSQGSGAIRPVTVGMVPQNVTIHPASTQQVQKNAAVRPSQRFGMSNESVIGSSGNFYGYSYGPKKGQTQQTGTAENPAGEIPSKPQRNPEPQCTSAAYAAGRPAPSASVHGTDQATAQCPVNVTAGDPQIPYKRDDGPVKNAPKREVMAEVVRRAIKDMK